MSIHLTENERIIKKIHNGKRYRRFVLFRDLFISILIAVVIQVGLSHFLSHLSSSINPHFSIWLAVMVFIAGLFFSAIVQIKFYATSYFLTTDRAIIVKGFFGRDMVSVKYEHILDTKVEQTFSERLLGIGTLYLSTANEHFQNKPNAEMLNQMPSFNRIDNPYAVHGTLEQLMEEHTSK